MDLRRLRVERSELRLETFGRIGEFTSSAERRAFDLRREGFEKRIGLPLFD